MLTAPPEPAPEDKPPFRDRAPPPRAPALSPPRSKREPPAPEDPNPPKTETSPPVAPSPATKIVLPPTLFSSARVLPADKVKSVPARAELEPTAIEIDPAEEDPVCPVAIAIDPEDDAPEDPLTSITPDV